MSVIAYEDIGLANPQIGPRLAAVISASELVGLPECVIPLGEIVIELLSKENRIMFLSMKTIRFPDFLNIGQALANFINFSKY